jgi:replicative DNA helicase
MHIGLLARELLVATPAKSTLRRQHVKRLEYKASVRTWRARKALRFAN